ncbi:MAG TPA: hypothetical protein VGM44_04160 [Polyangiaceae bacterium]|jgi:hypothetical protein
MTRGHHYPYFVLIFALAACGGSTPPAENPTAETSNEVTPPPPAPSTEDTATKPDAESTPPKKEDVPEPNFTPDMTVEQAIKAIPQGTERVNVDQETLSKPLQDEGLYEPCKPGSTHFTVKIAVWRGKAVAIDLNTTPKNPKLVECLKGRIRDLTWSVKVPSLNTVEYSM